MVITIGDANDEIPVCPVVAAAIPLDQSVAIGTSVFQLVVDDADIGVNAEVEFISVLNENSIFEVDSSTGDIRTIV